MANTEIGSSTGDTFGGEYQVFLSYRTRDTGPGFTNSLYHALVDAEIRVFFDDEELRPGESLTGSLLQALNDSKIYIPIFSKNYALSHWCLDEFAKMVENTSKSEDENKKVIFPIFYGVTSDDVKLDGGLYSRAIPELEGKKKWFCFCYDRNQKKKFSPKKIEEWRQALRDFDDTKGPELKNFKGYGHLSKYVVEEVLTRLSIKRRTVTKDLVGMEYHTAAINNLLDTDSDGECQVFLSFIESDTSRGFANTLHHALLEAGMHVVINVEEPQQLERVINNSKIYIPIFSPKFRSSHQFLNKLARMMENTSKSKKDGDKKVILPIFYDVKPRTLKRKPFHFAIRNLVRRSSFDEALGEVSDLTGFILKNYTDDGNLSRSVVNEIVDRLPKERSKDVQLVGIYGMTGIGKSTLAKIIFNQQYPHFGKYCSFLDDVSKTAKTKGLVKLQKQLLSDMSNSRVARNIEKIDHGIKMIGETICNKKALIVLDDVDDVNQIQELIGMNSLCPGTRILVTARDKKVLKIRGFKYEIVPYEMEKGLNDKDALQLFSRHAFNDDSPPEDYDTLSKGIVSTTGGLPLALEAIGSSLFLQKEQKIWKEKLEQLRKTPNRDVLGKLRISYDALEMDQQQIFLDVACFFIGEKKADAINLWRDRGFSPEDAIDVLISRSMMKVTNDHKFWMHDQFKDFGKAIANQEHPRLWARDNIIRESKSTEIMGSAQALCLQSDLSTQPPITVTTESYREKNPNQPIQGSDSKTEAGDPLLKTNQQNKEKRREIETESAKEQGEISQGESL